MKGLYILLIVIVVVVAGYFLITGFIDTEFNAEDSLADENPEDVSGDVDVIKVEEPGDETGEPSTQLTLSEIADTCNSLCRQDASDYCETERTIAIDGVDVVGTCRAFSRKDNVEGFDKCEGFCKSFDKAGVVCYVEGERDSNCDGIV